MFSFCNSMCYNPVEFFFLWLIFIAGAIRDDMILLGWPIICRVMIRFVRETLTEMEFRSTIEEKREKERSIERKIRREDS